MSERCAERHLNGRKTIAQHPELGDGYASALTNFGFLANDVVATEDAVQDIQAGR